MKKKLICLGFILLLTGCGENTDTLKCNSTTTTNGLTSNVTYDIKYDDNNDNVKYVTITYKYTQDQYTTTDITDGVGTGTDGTTEDDDVNEDDGIVDGAVGEAIDDGISAITETILDIAGLKTVHQNQMTTYENIEGFSYDIERDTDDEYKIVYKIDLEKISDSDLSTFNIDKNITNLQSTYENQGYTCS